MEFEDIEFVYESISPEQFWEDRYENYQAIKKSNEHHDKMNYAERATTVKLVRRALELAYNNVEEWLPDSFSFDNQGNMIGVNIKLLSTDLEKAVADEMRVTAARVKELLDEIGPDIDDVRNAE